MEHTDLSELLRKQEIIAEDPTMRQLYRRAVFLAKNNATILVTGESGVGKDRIAKFIHENSVRRNAPFIHINCSAIPQELFESELFGYDAGTFTGGLAGGKRGLLEDAQGGTVFLDEIGEMSLAGQVKILDFLQNKQIIRLGSGQRKDIDVRVISATNRDLAKRVAQGKFREDLYYRIRVVTLEIPPLRERPADVAAFAQKLFRQYDRMLSEDGAAFLRQCEWSGNMRELQNFVARACILLDAQTLTREELEPLYQSLPRPKPQEPKDEPVQAGETRLTLREAIAQFEKAYIEDAISNTATLSEAAAALGIDLDTLNRKKRQYGIYKRWNKRG